METLSRANETIGDINLGFAEVVGKSAISTYERPGSAEAPRVVITPEITEEIDKTPELENIIFNTYQNGSITDERDTRRALLNRLGYEDAMRGKKNKVETAVRRGHELGILRTLEIVKKRPNGEDQIVVAPLNHPNNFMRLNEEAFRQYIEIKSQQNPG